MTKGFHLARLEDGQDVPTTRGPSALMAPGDEYGALQQLADVIAIRQIILNFEHCYQTLSFLTDPTTGSAKTQTDPPAPMELLLSALTVQLLSIILDLTDLIHIYCLWVSYMC